MIPKPFLFVLLILLRHNNVGAVICGDCNQLQNIYNSRHTHDSSYDIARSFADRVFGMNRNERCHDPDYRAMIEHLSSYSSDERLDRFGFAMLSAIFYEKLSGRRSPGNTVLTSRHSELTQTMHANVRNCKIPVSFYYIDASNVKRSLDSVNGVRMPNGLYMPRPVYEYVARVDESRRDESLADFEYLVYLPLIVGSLYFHEEYSDRNLVRLREILLDGDVPYDPERETRPIERNRTIDRRACSTSIERRYDRAFPPTPRPPSSRLPGKSRAPIYRCFFLSFSVTTLTSKLRS